MTKQDLIDLLGQFDPEKLMKLAEAGIVSFYGYQVGGANGAAVAFLADRLAHSKLPNNQVAGAGLGLVLGSIGVLNAIQPIPKAPAPDSAAVGLGLGTKPTNPVTIFDFLAKLILGGNQ